MKLIFLSVKEGYFSPLAKESRTLLITADKRLGEVADAEDIQVWYCLEVERLDVLSVKGF